MDIFISWSGPRSRAVAEASKEYLPVVVNAFRPWLSTADIDKGARWSSDLAAALSTAEAGIICLTPNNVAAPYVLFESGALSRTVEKPFICTLLIGMEPSDISGPLAQFQATKPTRDDLLQLLRTLNKALGETALRDSQVETTFDLCWPKLKEKLENLPPDGSFSRPRRSERELLEELVDSVRSTSPQNTSILNQALKEISSVSAKLTYLSTWQPISSQHFKFQTLDDLPTNYIPAKLGVIPSSISEIKFSTTPLGQPGPTSAVPAAAAPGGDPNGTTGTLRAATRRYRKHKGGFQFKPNPKSKTQGQYLVVRGEGWADRIIDQLNHHPLPH